MEQKMNANLLTANNYDKTLNGQDCVETMPVNLRLILTKSESKEYDQ